MLYRCKQHPSHSMILDDHNTNNIAVRHELHTSVCVCLVSERGGRLFNSTLWCDGSAVTVIIIIISPHGAIEDRARKTPHAKARVIDKIRSSIFFFFCWGEDRHDPRRRHRTTTERPRTETEVACRKRINERRKSGSSSERRYRSRTSYTHHDGFKLVC